jgi:hypothetical protein
VRDGRSGLLGRKVPLFTCCAAPQCRGLWEQKQAPHSPVQSLAGSPQLPDRQVKPNFKVVSNPHHLLLPHYSPWLKHCPPDRQFPHLDTGVISVPGPQCTRPGTTMPGLLEIQLCIRTFCVSKCPTLATVGRGLAWEQKASESGSMQGRAPGASSEPSLGEQRRGHWALGTRSWCPANLALQRAWGFWIPWASPPASPLGGTGFLYQSFIQPREQWPSSPSTVPETHTKARQADLAPMCPKTRTSRH